MRILTIGDLHGKSVWQGIEPAHYDRVVFLGDYVDGVGIGHEETIDNLNGILKLKTEWPDKVVLLLGNHDIQYLEYPRTAQSDLDEAIQPRLTDLFRAHRAAFEIAFQSGRHLFTHAGISRGYYEFIRFRLDETTLFDETIPLADLINGIFQSDHRALLYVCGTRRGGFYPHGGPLWADMSETKTQFLPGYHHVVGHTKVPEIRTESSPQGSITYVDVLDTQLEFFEIDTGAGP